MINFLNLEYFLVAAEELNFTKAAKKLFISQQSLSNHISNMEKEFDVILFNRTTPLTLTYAGQALKAKAKQMLELRDETYRELADIKDFSVGQLTLGLSHTRGRVILPEILPVFKDRFPNIDLKLIEGNSSELADDLLHGNIDLIIDMLPFKVENVETVPICEEEILLAVPDTVLEHAFPGRLNEITAFRAYRLKTSGKLPVPFDQQRKPCPHHRRRNVRGSAGYAAYCSGNRKHSDCARPGRKRHGHYVLPAYVHLRPGRDPGAEKRPVPVKLLFPGPPKGTRRSGNRLPQRSLYVPGNQSIHTDCKRNHINLKKCGEDA